MISEPELVGGEPLDGPEVLDAAPPPRGHRTRRPWRWALGGAVLASALWGGGLYAYGQRAESGPDLGGYTVEANLCEASELKALASTFGARTSDSGESDMNDPALYESSCMITFGASAPRYSASVRYTLHRVTDPGPEFPARAKYYDFSEPIAGLGEMAFFAQHGDDGGELRVLDGQVVIELIVYREYEVDASGNPVDPVAPMDMSGIEVPMTQDVQDVIAALKK
ncbi:hypothetical protein ACFW2Y_07000 [Streptomyces sp. NPDC058877]|uniref:hypothetical protein n=1 Tax=unclassified Streptomyces TaxID=2593676 RepID=UPI0036B7B78E